MAEVKESGSNSGKCITSLSLVNVKGQWVEKIKWFYQELALSLNVDPKAFMLYGARQRSPRVVITASVPLYQCGVLDGD